MIEAISLGAGLAWASGLRLYLTVLIAGVLARAGWLHLPDTLAVLTSPWVIGAAGVLAVTEFLADKIPAFDSLWDAVHTFIRIPAGAVLAAGALGHADPTVLAIAGLAGGSLAGAAHVAKAGTRALINLSRSRSRTGSRRPPRTGSCSAASRSHSSCRSRSWCCWRRSSRRPRGRCRVCGAACRAGSAAWPTMVSRLNSIGGKRD
jgi:hypothetical protein